MDMFDPSGHMGPPDQFATLKVQIVMRVFLLDEDAFPLLIRVGGFYLWWDFGWKRDGSVPIDDQQVRRYLWKAQGTFEFLDD
ncbi:hypothetical protein APB26_32660 [Pseudomonas aeruginosa]|nr:hypothetical protein APB26_32660 [Pseudomonas aeruginosa]RPV61408.1 hypothetical protein IPC838_19000 [Pseudomonas aeruginosa]